jgi:hypothetical protein
MRNDFLTLLGAVAIAAATVQFAMAGERQKIRKPAHASKTTTEQFRNSNAAWTAPLVVPDAYRYSGGWSAPAGR